MPTDQTAAQIAAELAGGGGGDPSNPDNPTIMEYPKGSGMWWVLDNSSLSPTWKRTTAPTGQTPSSARSLAPYMPTQPPGGIGPPGPAPAGNLPPGYEAGPPGTTYYTDPNTGKRMLLDNTTGQIIDEQTGGTPDKTAALAKYEQQYGPLSASDRQRFLLGFAPAAASSGFASQSMQDLQYAHDQGLLSDSQYAQALTAKLMGTGGGLSPYESGQLDIANRRLGLDTQQFGLSRLQGMIDAAKTGNPLSYLSLIRGAPPGATDQIYQGLDRVVPALPMPAELGGVSTPGPLWPQAGGGAGAGYSQTGNVPATPYENWGGGTMNSGELLNLIGEAAQRRGLDPGVVRAIATVEGGLGGATGDAGLSHGPFQFYFGGGQGNNFARDMGMTDQQAQQYIQQNPMAAVNWALDGYLGNSIRQGMAKGLQGPNLATYAQQYGQVSVSPERAGAAYNGVPSLPGGTVQPIGTPIPMTQPTAWQAPPMPPAMATVQSGAPLGTPTLPAGTLRLPGVQAQANMTPMERQAQLEAVAFQGVNPTDYQWWMDKTRKSAGPGLPEASYAASPIGR